MAIRILLLLLSVVISVNLIIIIVSYLCNVNMYQKYGRAILGGFCILILLVVITYIVLSILGLA